MPDLSFRVCISSDDESKRIVPEKLSDIIVDAEAHGLECECVERKTGPFMAPDIVMFALTGVTISFYIASIAFGKSFGETLGREVAMSAWDVIKRSAEKLHQRFVSSDRDGKLMMVSGGKVSEPEHGELRLLLLTPDRNVCLVFKNGSDLESFMRSINKFSELIDWIREDPSRAAGYMGEPDPFSKTVVIEWDEENNKFRRVGQKCQIP